MKVILVALLLLDVTAAFAQGSVQGRGPGRGPVIQNCGAEISKFCSDKKHDGAVRTCLESHRRDLSATCRRALETTRPRR